MDALKFESEKAAKKVFSIYQDPSKIAREMFPGNDEKRFARLFF